MLTTVASSTTMNWARQAITRTSQGLTAVRLAAAADGGEMVVVLMQAPWRRAKR